MHPLRLCAVRAQPKARKTPRRQVRYHVPETTDRPFIEGTIMPIRIHDALPATAALESENIFVMTEYRALHQDIRPLRVVLLNLMPTKITTETQIMRKLSNTPLQIEVTLLHTASHSAKNTSEAHLESFYRTFDEIKDEHFDGMIITGAPVERLDFGDVDYWDELCRIMEWTKTNVHSTLHICWGAQAGIYYHYGVEKHMLEHKMFGVFKHYLVKRTSPLVRGFDDEFYAPHSRFTEVRAADIEANPDLELIALSDEAGVYIAKSVDSRYFFVFGHPEYDAGTLKAEYDRDVAQGMNPELPRHYYPNDDPTRRPRSTWRAHAQLLYTNWLNYYVYQTTPYDVQLAGGSSDGEAANARLVAVAAAAASASASDDDAADAVRRAGVPVGRIVAAVQGADGEDEAAKTDAGTQAAQPAAPADDGPAAHAAQPTQPAAGAAKPTSESPYLRPENEDDDGYDPYSDRRDEPPLFEPDPWN